MNRTGQLAQCVSVLILGSSGILMPGLSVLGQDVQHLSITQPGGMPGRPVVTGITRITNGVSVTWDGTPGSYGNCQLFKKSSLSDPKWLAVGSPTLSGKATVSPATGNAFFRVSGPSPQYAGSQNCQDCHGATYSVQIKTPHAGAFTNALFKTQGGQTNSACLPCHTVGYGLPTGFVIGNNLSPLRAVQCENCHGPAGNHAASEIDPTVRPRIELAATVCGGCHSAKAVPAGVAAEHPPRYEEWNSSGHRAVRAELQADFAGTNGTNSYIPTCGRCHSGTVREALQENNPLPYGHEAGAVGIACATCHDPHQVNVFTNVQNGVVLVGMTGATITNTQLGAVYTNQLRYPLFSTNDYHTTNFSSTSYSREFAADDNPRINICGQCHNDQGASTNKVDRPPHSPQYNMLIGTAGGQNVNLPFVPLPKHALLEKQCVGCHMQKAGYVSAAKPAVSGHTFMVDTHATKLNPYEFCGPCHGGSVLASNWLHIATTGVSNTIHQYKYGLDLWASTKAPASLQTKYGVRAWEYTQPGALSNPHGETNAGPNLVDQALIPGNIQQARFNLYLVYADGSYGVHNGPYCAALLEAARISIEAELKK